MDTDPSANDLNLARERATIVEAANKIAAVLAQAHLEERPELVKAVDETLNDAGVVVIDTSDSGEDERRGKHHPELTRANILEIFAKSNERLRRKKSKQPITRYNIL